MARYDEELNADPARVRRALEGLIGEEEAEVARLEQELASATARLDQKVVRLMLFRDHFGPTHPETTRAQNDALEASKPVADLTETLAHRRAILQIYRDRLLRLDGGAPAEIKLRPEDLLLE